MLEQWLSVVRTYFSEYGVAFVFVALFLENVMFLGVVIPGVVVLLICGWLANQGNQSPYPLMLFGFLGTVSGDATSYAIGNKLGDRLLRSKRWGKGLASATERIRREPAVMTFCHFVSYLRMFVPMSAGAARVPFGRWLRLDASGAALWVVSHVLVGYYLSMSLAHAYMERVALIVAVALGILIVARYLFRRRSAAEKELPS